jgi:hypothetical protein
MKKSAFELSALNIWVIAMSFILTGSVIVALSLPTSDFAALLILGFMMPSLLIVSLFRWEWAIEFNGAVIAGIAIMFLLYAFLITIFINAYRGFRELLRSRN